jgi:hypothetical protein
MFKVFFMQIAFVKNFLKNFRYITMLEEELRLHQKFIVKNFKSNPWGY